MSALGNVLKAGLVLVPMAFASYASHADVIYTLSSGTRAATADFALSGTTLTVTLTNTSTADATDPTDVLTGVFFDTSKALTAASASLNGSSVVYGSIVNNVGEGWQYKGGISVQGKNAGISAAGLGVFGPDGNFFSSAVKVGGLDYGILSAGDNSATANGGLTHGPLIKDSVVFKLTTASGFTLANLGSTVVFQYGTELNEPHFASGTGVTVGSGGGGNLVPEPLSIGVLGISLAALGAVRRRRPA